MYNDGAKERAMVESWNTQKSKRAKKQDARTGCFFGISLSSSFPFSFPSSLFLSFLFLQECSVNFFDESEIKEQMNTSSTTLLTVHHTNNTKPHSSTGQQILSYTAQLIQIAALLHITDEELHRNLYKTQNCKSSSVLENFRRDAPICTYDFVLQWKLDLVVKPDSNLTSHLMEVTMAQGRLHIHIEARKKNYYKKIFDYPKSF